MPTEPTKNDPPQKIRKHTPRGPDKEPRIKKVQRPNLRAFCRDMEPRYREWPPTQTEVINKVWTTLRLKVTWSTIQREKTRAKAKWTCRPSGSAPYKRKLPATKDKPKIKVKVPASSPKPRVSDFHGLSPLEAIRDTWILADKVGGMAELASIVAALQRPGGTV